MLAAMLWTWMLVPQLWLLSEAGGMKEPRKNQQVILMPPCWLPLSPNAVRPQEGAAVLLHLHHPQQRALAATANAAGAAVLHAAAPAGPGRGGVPGGAPGTGVVLA